MLRTWDLNIVIQREGGPVARQIVQAIVYEIRRGRLMPGAPLPGSREMAKALGVNRKTVILAYEELYAQGWLKSEKTRGTFVSSELPEKGIETLKPADSGIASALGVRLAGSGPDVQCLYSEDGYLTFDDGAPDTRLVPVAELAAAWRKALLYASQRNRLGYGDPRGTKRIRHEILGMLSSERGITAGEDNICIVRGSQMGIYVAARVLVRPGDCVVIEALSYPPAREAFRAAGAEIVAVGLDGDGLKVDELEKLCYRKRVRAVYVTPHHQFPTTVLLNFAIIEDDYSHEFHFTHRPMLPLASFDRRGKVIYVGSMSKLLTPSLRIGYLIAPSQFIDRAAAEVTIIDRQGDPATEAAIADLLASGVIHSHTKKVMKIYAERRDLLASLLASQLDEWISFQLPVGGLALWAACKVDIDMDALQAAADREGVRFLPAGQFSLKNRSYPALRLGFGSLNAEELKDAVARLRRAFLATIQ
jgi:GntR family transcriptional regulator/MocR family aminotransferase